MWAQSMQVAAVAAVFNDRRGDFGAEALQAGHRVSIVWSGIHDFSDALRQVR